MSITALLGVLIAIAIVIIIVRVLLQLATHFGYASAPISAVVWAAAFILCVLLLAYGLGIPVPFFRW